jgi:serine/threonine protein kinase
MLEVGSTPIPGYRLTRRLGAGAFAEVMEARTSDGRIVALKFLDTRSRYGTIVRSEARVWLGLTELQHPGIVPLYGVMASSHYLVLSMERADGDLNQLHRTYQEDFGTHIPREDVLELLAPVAETLDFLAGVGLPNVNASSPGLQHCDIKPANLLVVGDRVKVGDFGLCTATTGKTHRGGGWRGTRPYAAPELFQGRVSNRTDQYALAVTWCELCEGEAVFNDVPITESGSPALPIELMKLPAGEARVIARALQHQPALRYPSCKEFLDDLRRAYHNTRQMRKVVIAR